MSVCRKKRNLPATIYRPESLFIYMYISSMYACIFIHSQMTLVMLVLVFSSYEESTVRIHPTEYVNVSTRAPKDPQDKMEPAYTPFC